MWNVNKIAFAVVNVADGMARVTCSAQTHSCESYFSFHIFGFLFAFCVLFSLSAAVVAISLLFVVGECILKLDERVQP